MTEAEAFKLLGLKPGASPDRVRNRYREKAWETHPDRGGEVSAFQDLVDALRVALEAANTWPCETCHGTGRSAVKVKTGFGALANLMCGHCGGTGKKW